MPAYITITARLARDPELRETAHGKSLCKLSLPNDSGWGDNKLTTWWGCTIWGKRGETAAKHLKKGDWVTVTGVPSLRKYEKRDGSEGSSLEVEVNDWGFCGPKPEGETAPEGSFERNFKEHMRRSRSASIDGKTYNSDAPSPDIPF